MNVCKKHTMDVLATHLLAVCLSFTGCNVFPPSRSWAAALEYLVNDPKLYIDWLIKRHNGIDNALIAFASKKHDTRVVKALLARGADVHADGCSALMGAVQNGCASIVKLLIDGGVDVHAWGEEALMRASEKGFTDIVRVLIDAGVDVNVQDGFPLIATAIYGHVGAMVTLLNAGAQVNPGHGHVLSAAAHAGHVDAVRVLLEAGADVNMDTFDQDCAIMQAAWSGHLDVVHVLLDAGANANDYSALIGSAVEGHVDVLNALLDAGADAQMLDEFVYVDIAGEGRTQVLQLLLGVDDRMCTYLDAMITSAAVNNHIETTRMLCKYKLSQFL